MKKNIEYIDSLKIIGAFIIAFYHITGVIGIPNNSFSLTTNIARTLSAIGYIPVEMFFFISGYLMVYNYSDKIKKIDFLEYIIKKIGKIYPFLIINIFLCSLFSIIYYHNFDIYQLIYNLFIFQGGVFPGAWDFRIDIAGGGTWFLTPLFLSYILFFFISKYKKEETALGTYIAIALLSMMALKNNFNYPIINGYMLRGLLGFFAGSIFSSIIKKYGFKIPNFIKVIVLFFISAYVYIIISKQYNNTIDFIIYTDIVFLPCLFLICENVNWFKNILTSTRFKKISSLSMPLFFLNIPVAYFFKMLITDTFGIVGWGAYVLYFVILIIFSLIFMNLIKLLPKTKNAK